jgi:hypothetical protein
MNFKYCAITALLFASSTALADNVTIIAAPMAATTSADARTATSSPSHKVIYYRFSVPRKEAQNRIDTLLASGEYRAVALDVAVQGVPVRQQSMGNIPVGPYSPFNDTFYPAQTYFMTADESPDGIGITQAQSYLVPYRPMEIGVVDGGFADSLDVVYSNPADTINGGADAFETCTTTHGLGVASVIGATRNNSYGMTGMMDVDIVPVRALDCEVGSLYDVAEGVYYLAGAELENDSIPVRSRPVDVINLSLGGVSECGFFMQESIDFARSQGVTVVVSAGNASVDASQIAPANCDGVITVGALTANAQGVDNDAASFTNFGGRVDIAAKGVDIVGLSNDDTGAYYSGTSFSAPLVSAAVGMLKQLSPTMTPDETQWWLQFTSTPYPDDSRCQALGCGPGALNVAALLASYTQHASSPATIQPLLLSARLCDDVRAYTSNNSLLPLMCGRYEISLPQYQITQPYTLSVYMTDASGNKRLLGETDSPSFVLAETIDTRGSYAYQICLAGQVCSPEYPIDISDETPAICL